MTLPVRPTVAVMARKLAPSAYVEPASSTAARRTLVNVFGTPRAKQWRVPASGTEAGLRAAQLQHELARQFRDAINASDAGNVSEFTRRHPAFTYDRLRGILSGDVWMRLEDIAELSALLDRRVSIVVGSDREASE
ncbi:MAG: hypothetical protein RL219_1455 [Actinomycetota bacterium]|jgi:hypothetical protein